MKVMCAAVVAFLLVAGGLTAKAQMTMSAEQKGVWTGEEAYCRYRMTKDLDGFMSLWDDAFVGWPLSSPKPTGKAGIREVAAHRIAAENRYECESTPLAINVFGDTANTYYLLHSKVTDKDGKTNEDIARITHTWRRANGRWKIIGGMGAPHPTEHH